MIAAEIVFFVIAFLIFNSQCQDILSESFHKMPLSICSKYPIGQTKMLPSKHMCHVTCNNNCLGISYSPKTQICNTHECQLQTQGIKLDTNFNCYMLPSTQNAFSDDDKNIDLIQQRSSSATPEGSSNVLTSKPQLAIDRDPNTCFTSQVETNPWWGIDLGIEYYIEHVNITNPFIDDRILCDIQVSISLDLPSNQLDIMQYSQTCSNYNGCGVFTGGVYQVICSPCILYGRFVIIQVIRSNPDEIHPDTNTLTLCEVEIYGSSSSETI